MVPYLTGPSSWTLNCPKTETDTQTDIQTDNEILIIRIIIIIIIINSSCMCSPSCRPLQGLSTPSICVGWGHGAPRRGQALPWTNPTPTPSPRITSPSSNRPRTLVLLMSTLTHGAISRPCLNVSLLAYTLEIGIDTWCYSHQVCYSL